MKTAKHRYILKNNCLQKKVSWSALHKFRCYFLLIWPLVDDFLFSSEIRSLPLKISATLLRAQLGGNQSLARYRPAPNIHLLFFPALLKKIAYYSFLIPIQYLLFLYYSFLLQIIAGDPTSSKWSISPSS